MIVVKIGILVFKGTHRKSSVVRGTNCAILRIVSLSFVALSIFHLSLTHSELTTPPDGDMIARHTHTVVPVSDADVLINGIDDSAGEFIVLVSFS